MHLINAHNDRSLSRDLLIAERNIFTLLFSRNELAEFDLLLDIFDDLLLYLLFSNFFFLLDKLFFLFWRPLSLILFGLLFLLPLFLVLLFNLLVNILVDKRLLNLPNNSELIHTPSLMPVSAHSRKHEPASLCSIVVNIGNVKESATTFKFCDNLLLKRDGFISHFFKLALEYLGNHHTDKV